MNKPEPDEVQVRLRGPRSSWMRPDVTKDEPTTLLRAEYLVRNWPKVYEMRLLYAHPPEHKAMSTMHKPDAVPEPVNGLVSVFSYDEVLTFTFRTEADADKFMARFEPTVDSAAPGHKA